MEGAIFAAAEVRHNFSDFIRRVYGPASSGTAYYYNNHSTIIIATAAITCYIVVHTQLAAAQDIKNKRKKNEETIGRYWLSASGCCGMED